MCCIEWVTEPFLVRDQIEFEDWLTNYWPEATFFRDNRGYYVLGPNYDFIYDWTGSEIYNTPTARYDPAADEYYEFDSSIFLEELSYRILDGEPCILAMYDRCGCMNLEEPAVAIAIRGGSEPPEHRMASVSLIEAAYQRCTDLAGGRLLIAAE